MLLPVELAILVAAFIVASLAVARVTRLITADTLPPLPKLRDWSANHLGALGELFICPWCVSFWVALADLAWAWGSSMDGWWWGINTLLAVAWVGGWLGAVD